MQEGHFGLYMNYQFKHINLFISKFFLRNLLVLSLFTLWVFEYACIAAFCSLEIDLWRLVNNDRLLHVKCGGDELLIRFLRLI